MTYDPPAAPENFVAAADGHNIALSWDARDGAAKYVLSYAANGGAMTVISDALTATSYVLENQPSGSYEFNIVSGDENGYLSSDPAVCSVELAPVAPVSKAATDVTTYGCTANWEAIAESGATYTVTVFDAQDALVDAFAELDGTSYVIQGLPAGDYTYTVKATVNGITSAASSAQAFTIEASQEFEAPIAFDAEDVSYTGFTAGWSPVVGAESYQAVVTCNDAAIDGSPFTVTEGTELAVAVKALGTYSYKVKAINGEGQETDFSNVVEVEIALDAPVSAAATDLTADDFSANWEAVDAAEKYVLTLAKFNGESYEPCGTPIVTDDTTVLIAVETLGSYQYTVQAAVANADGNLMTSAASEAQTVEVVFPTVEDFKATAQTSDTITFSWTKSELASGYVLTLVQPDGTPLAQNLDSNETISYKFENLTQLGDYSATIHAVSAAGKTTDESEAVNVSVTLTAPVKVRPGTMEDYTSNTLTVAWGEVPNAAAYVIELADAEDFAEPLVAITNDAATLEHTFTGLEPQTYYFRLKALAAEPFVETCSSPWGQTFSVNLGGWIQNYDAIVIDKFKGGVFTYAPDFAELDRGASTVKECKFLDRRTLPGWSMQTGEAVAQQYTWMAGGTRQPSNYGACAGYYTKTVQDAEESHIALMGRGQGSYSIYYVLAFTNKTTRAITSLDISYDAVLYYDTSKNYYLRCYYQTNDAATGYVLNNAQWNELSDMRYQSPGTDTKATNPIVVTPKTQTVDLTAAPVEPGKCVLFWFFVGASGTAPTYGFGDLSITFHATVDKGTVIMLF